VTGGSTRGSLVRRASRNVEARDPEQATDGNTGASSYWSSNAGPNQDLWIDYGKPIDLAGVTMTPLASNGPKNYTVSLSSSASCADGTSGYSVIDTKTNASSSAATTSSFAATTARCVLLHTTASWGSLVKVVELARVRPSTDVDPIDPQPDATGLAQINLARGGVNSATVRIRNNTGSSQSVTVGASGLPTGVTSNSPSATVPANSSSDVTLTLTAGGTAATSGTTSINVTGTGAASAPMTIRHTDNLALNDVGTALPAASSNGEDPSFLYPPKLAFDGSTTGSSFWVSRPASLGAGDPVCLVVDLGSSVNVGRAVMTPRTSSNLGPKDYKVQTSTTGGTDCISNTGWTDRATFTNASATSPTTSTWTAASARYVRIRITANPGSGPPFQSQVRELGLYPN
jgi:hypothetical protein